MKLIDPATGQAVWDSNDPNAGPVPPAPEGRQWVRVDEPGDTMAPRRTAPGILDIGNGVTERLAFLNQTFNPVEGIGSAMRAGSRMVAPDQSYWDRIASLGDMVSGVASIAAPIAAAKAIGVPAASAMMEGLLGASPTSQAATDMARQFGVDESGALRLFHGSPHNFDRFSMSKIGTGEGAQAYGQGLYFAEAEDVARGYRDQLANGWRLEVRDPVREAGITGRDLDSASQMLSTSYSGKAAADDWENWTGKTLTPEQRSAFEEAFARKGGSMYEVEINANPEDFIDYDAPLSAQPPNVKRQFGYVPKPTPQEEVAAFELAKRESPNNIGDHPAIQELYRREAGANAAARNFQRQVTGGGVDEAARITLSEAGIPGIRYADAGSRIPFQSWRMLSPEESTSGKWVVGNAPNGPNKYFDSESDAMEYFEANKPPEPTRNYVVFDENLINIVRKYGIAGAAAMLGVSAFDVEQALAENMSPSQWDKLVVGPQ